MRVARALSPKCEAALAKLETRPNCLRVRCAGKLEN